VHFFFSACTICFILLSTCGERCLWVICIRCFLIEIQFPVLQCTTLVSA
jgi:hypothetical protein